jgi:hypothetical protein
MKRFMRLNWTRKVVVLIAVLALLALPLVALADNVVNDVVSVPASITLNAGDPSSYVDVQFYIQPTSGGGDPDPQCNFDTTSEQLTFTINTPSGVTASPASLTFNKCKDGGNFNAQTVRFSAAASAVSGNISFNETLNNSGGTFNYSNADFYVNVVIPNTPPSVSVTGVTNGESYEFGTVPTAGCAVADAEDGNSSFPATLSAISGPLSAYGLGSQTASCSYTDGGGLSDSDSATYSIVDTTPPTITFVSRTAANVNGWNNGDVTVNWSCSDLVGVVSASVSETVSTEGENQSVTGTCEDTTGNTASDTQSGINIDKTAPTLTWNGGPADGGVYYFNFVPAVPTCTANDALSGPDGCGVTGYGTSVGPHTMTATALDVAGNSYSETRTYTVEKWTLSGFYQPVDMGNILNVVKGGSTVPLKFEVFAGPTELTATSVVKSFVQAKIACDISAPSDEIEVTTTGGTSLRYDTTAGQFIQNWQTPKSPGVCYMVTMTTQDGSKLVAYFKLK